MSAAHAIATGAWSRPRSEWSWPLDLTRYDRTPTLTPAEHAALVALGWEVRRGRGHDLQRLEWGTIARLVRPLDDARRSVFTPENPYHHRSALDDHYEVERAQLQRVGHGHHRRVPFPPNGQEAVLLGEPDLDTGRQHHGISKKGVRRGFGPLGGVPFYPALARRADGDHDQSDNEEKACAGEAGRNDPELIAHDNKACSV